MVIARSSKAMWSLGRAGRSLDQLRGETLHPTVDGDVIDGDLQRDPRRLAGLAGPAAEAYRCLLMPCRISEDRGIAPSTSATS
jgi:hypothetical protein